MTWRWPAALGLAAAAIGAIAVTTLPKAATDSDRPRLALLTSLPLLLGEQFGLEAPRSEAVTRIGRDFTIAPIAVADQASLAGHSLLLMAHPRAQPAEALVELDRWVRSGGTVVLLADPHLAWESSRPLGDRLRPPPDFADTGLLGHWGLRLAGDEAGEGSLRATSNDCTVREDGLVGRCRVGRGSARVIADADFIMGKGEDAPRRLALLMRQLRAESPR